MLTYMHMYDMSYNVCSWFHFSLLEFKCIIILSTGLWNSWCAFWVFFRKMARKMSNYIYLSNLNQCPLLADLGPFSVSCSDRSKLRLCSANHRAGYFSNLPCDWQSTAWAYSEQETENGPSSVGYLSTVSKHFMSITQLISKQRYLRM